MNNTCDEGLVEGLNEIVGVVFFSTQLAETKVKNLIPLRALSWLKPRVSGFDLAKDLVALSNNAVKKFSWAIGAPTKEGIPTALSGSEEEIKAQIDLDVPRTPEAKIAKIIGLRLDGKLSSDYLHTSYMKHRPPQVGMIKALNEADYMIERQRRIDLRMELVGESREWYEHVEMYPWQRTVWNRLAAPPDARNILWVFDKTGGRGKSTLMRHYYYLNYDTTLVFTNVPKKDLLYQAGQKVIRKVVIINLTKSDKVDELDYSAYENLKDNLFTVSKYHGDMVDGKPLTILILANDEPAYGGMILDRWNIGEIMKHDSPIQWFTVHRDEQTNQIVRTYKDLPEVEDVVGRNHVYLNLHEAAQGGNPPISRTASEIAQLEQTT